MDTLVEDEKMKTARHPSEKRPLSEALNLISETDDVEFKSHFDFSQPGERLEILKDIAALANSGGGYIFFGVDDLGMPTENAHEVLHAVDPAQLVDLIYGHTGVHFAGFSIDFATKGGSRIPLLIVEAAEFPLVFCKAGNYTVGTGTQQKSKCAFSNGTTYFRHGAKSEPGCSEDSRNFIERKLEQARDHWKLGFAQVISSPVGSKIEVVHPNTQLPHEPAKVRLCADPSAPAVRAISIDETHPFRQTELLEELKSAVGGSIRITSHHLQCVRKVMRIDQDVAFTVRTQYGSRQYSREFLGMLVEKVKENPDFFTEMAEQCKKKSPRFPHSEFDLGSSKSPVDKPRSWAE